MQCYSLSLLTIFEPRMYRYEVPFRVCLSILQLSTNTGKHWHEENYLNLEQILHNIRRLNMGGIDFNEYHNGKACPVMPQQYAKAY